MKPLAIVLALFAFGCGKKKKEGGDAPPAPAKTTVHTVDDPGFSVDLPEGMTPKPGENRVSFEGAGPFDTLNLTWDKPAQPAAELIEAGKKSYSAGEPDLKATQVEGTLPGGGPWVAVAKGKFRGSKSWLTLGEVVVSCQGSGTAAEACKQLRAK